MRGFYYILFILFIAFSMQLSAQEPSIVFVIHGGAGTILKKNIGPETEREIIAILDSAVTSGYNILKKGGTNFEAIETAIKIMEDSPHFNAGKGAVFNSNGENDLDASVMDGKTLKAGAVSGLTTVKNPITVALRVMDSTPFVMLSGAGAEKFAREQKVTIVDPSYFYTEKRFQQLKRLQEGEKKSNKLGDGRGYIFPEESKTLKYGTVGAVALDKYGNLAAGTSTGGMTNKKYGRIGDAPIIGAGTYANNKTCAVSGTGHGEYFIRAVVAYDISALMEYKGLSLVDAANYVVNKKLVEMDGEGGVIAVDHEGNYAMPFNSEGMYRAVIDKNGNKIIGIYKE